jgi:hypothetical protein
LSGFGQELSGNDAMLSSGEQMNLSANRAAFIFLLSFDYAKFIRTPLNRPMKKTLFIFGVLTLVLNIRAEDEWKVSQIGFDRFESTNPLKIPKDFAVSKFGKGKYRLDGMDSFGRLNCIFFFFEPVPANETPKQELEWKEEQMDVEGKTIIRKEAVILNPFVRQNDDSRALLRVRVDVAVAKKELAASLSQIAEQIIKNTQSK